VDAYRAFAILTVVLGHWLAFALVVRDGALSGRNLLEIWPPAPWLTWFFQVMPLFFVVGGYANAASLDRRDPSRTSTLGWIGLRLWRLLLPSLVLLLVATAAAVVARLLGAGGAMLDLALAVVGLPLWFLAVYLLVVATTPWLVAAERRLAWRLPLLLACLVVVADVLFNHLGVPLVGWSTYAWFWLGVYCLGICWRHGTLPTSGWLPPTLALGGFTALVLLVTLGPYPVSMLAAPGSPVQNNGPPSVALLALALTQVGVVLLLRPAVERACRRRRVWAGVVAVNLVAMSIYLWHMVAAVAASVVFWLTGLAAAAEAPSGEWWLQRPLWYLTCGLLLALLVRLVRPVEWRRPVLDGRPGSTGRGWLLAAGVLLAAVGMLQLTVSGLTAGPAGLPVAGLGAYLAGMLAVRAGAGIVGVQPLLDAPARR
jgi:fucose 4-O-acetylase-like acetyltransferase